MKQVLALFLSSCVVPLHAAEPRVVRERIEWLDVWVPGNDVADLPRVLLVGDSITRGYYKSVEEKLAGKAIVCRLATSKSLGDPGLLAEVNLVLSQTRFDVLHVNNGMHGWGYSEEEYTKALPDLLAALRKGAPKSRIVWATTTPVRVADKLDQSDAKTERVMVRNQAVVDLMTKEKIAVNDLFAEVKDRPEMFSRDGVHMSPKGTAALSEKVAAEVQKLIATP